MADNLTGGELISTCRQYGEIDDDYWDDTKLLRAINDATRELWDRVLAAPGGDAFLLKVSSDLTVTAGTDTVDLPADCGVEIKQVEVSYDGGYRPLRTFNLPERSDETVVTQSEKLGTCYRVIGGQKLLLSPKPTWSGNVRVWYVALPAAIADDATSHDFFFGWDRFVWNWVCHMHARSRGEIPEADGFLQAAMLALNAIIARAARARTPSANFIRDDYAEDYKNRWPWGRRT